jgi:hypothetical protein
MAAPSHATVTDFRDLDLMLRIAEEEAIESADLASALGFGDNVRPVGIRLAWMRRYGMLKLDQKARLWSLTAGGERVVEAKLRAATASRLQAVPDEEMIEVMAYITGRFRRGDTMLGTMLRREFLFGTKRR